MQRDIRLPGLLALGAMLILSGCSIEGLAGRGKPTTPAPATESHELSLVRDYLRTLDRVGSGGAAEQAEIIDAARRAVAVDPTTASRLRLALILAAPGHPASNAQEARSMLTELLASPEQLLPLERSLATVMLNAANARATVDAENQQLRSDATRSERERTASLNRRIQALSAENEHLRRNLEEASAKLDAIAALERQMSGDRRSGGSNGAKP